MGISEIEGRYDRNHDTFSLEEQEKLGRSRVVVIGLGGLGGGVCEMLARVGVGHLTLIDGDSFEASNLNRQLLSEESLIGVSKASAAKKRVTAINSSIEVTELTQYLDETSLESRIKNADVVMDCLDSIDTRFKLQAAAKKENIPIVSGAIAGVTGQLITIFPGDAGYSLIYGENGQNQTKGVEVNTGNIAYCALFVASLQSSECIKILLKRGDLLRNKMLIAELWTNIFEVVDLV
jgi:molybdopterin/thiamine biosynthesis adenylyltransferase